MGVQIPRGARCAAIVNWTDQPPSKRLAPGSSPGQRAQCTGSVGGTGNSPGSHPGDYGFESRTEYVSRCYSDGKGWPGFHPGYGAGSIPVSGSAEGARIPAGAHNPGYVGSNPTSATNLPWRNSAAQRPVKASGIGSSPIGRATGRPHLVHYAGAGPQTARVSCGNRPAKQTGHKVT